MSKITHIIFDWDGTLMDSSAKIVRCMQISAQLAELPVPTPREVRKIIGISLLPAIQILFNVNESKANEVVEHYKTVFIESDKTPCPLFDGVIDALQRLSNEFTLGVATGKARRGLERAWANTNSGHFFDDSRCADEAESKPSSDMLEQLCSSWGIAPQQAIMVGDTTYDMQMAEKIHMPRLGVSFGAHDAKTLVKHKPIGIIDHIAEIYDYVQNVT